MATLEMILKEETIKYLRQALDNERFKTKVSKMYAEVCDPYVPYISGALSKNIKIDSTGITYNQQYASNVYDSMNVHNKEYHPLASSRWDDVAFANHKDEIAQKTEEILEQWIRTRR